MKNSTFDEKVKFILNNYIGEHIFGKNREHHAKVAKLIDSFSKDELVAYHKALNALDPFIKCIEKDKILSNKLETNVTLKTFKQFGENYFLMEKYAKEHGFFMSLSLNMVKSIDQCPVCVNNTHSDGHTHH